ncbi:DUF6544 family protein [Euzebya tangerina]|uniref:DUF6544 family protein n=1 Tax=Euzebya tangerina TaxID=591198 RepID=UPI0013C32FDB|nr:DUF6544 family protein [Euzebya tangerina]
MTSGPLDPGEVPEWLDEASRRTWEALQVPAHVRVAHFDPSTIRGLPPPAARLLERALPPGTPLQDIVTLRMRGHIKLGVWLPFEATQILRAGLGLVWAPRVSRRPLWIQGADVLGPDGAEMAFKLAGRVQLVHESGPAVVRSAAGRLAAETVAWLPQALTPQMGARWHPIDDDRARVVLRGPCGSEEVDVTVDGSGHIAVISLERWNPAADPPTAMPFSGRSTATSRWDGVHISGAGEVGWGTATPSAVEGVFFRYRVTAIHFGGHEPLAGDGGS